MHRPARDSDSVYKVIFFIHFIRIALLWFGLVCNVVV